MKPLAVCLLALLCLGCTENRSISAYGSGYNPSYLGELSQIGFIKDVAAPDGPAASMVQSGEHAAESAIAVRPGQRLLIIQSGQAYPDAELLQAFPQPHDLVPLSGNPEIGTVDRISLRAAARAGGVAYILGYWGTIRTTQDDQVSVVLSAILADVAAGTWRPIEIASPAEQKAFSFFNAKGADDRQVQRLKADIYRRLVAVVLVPPAPTATPP